MSFTEIETKYDASEVSLQDFKNIIKDNEIEIKKRLLVSSFDSYYVDKNDQFIRYRYNEGHGELTIKRKTQEHHNFNRIEVNIPTAGDNEKAVTEFVSLLGYSHNFSIYKTCDIYWTDKVDLVYYVVYDKEFKELRRFIEIEALEDYPWESEEQVWNEITKYEKMLEPLGIKPQNRLRKSLFETFYVD